MTLNVNWPSFQSNIDVYNKNSRDEYNISFSYGVVEYDPRKHSAVKRAMMNEGKRSINV